MNSITIITTVGTSWFTNLSRAKNSPEAHNISDSKKERLENQQANRFNPQRRAEKDTLEAGAGFGKGYRKHGKNFTYSDQWSDEPNEDACAELSSLRSILQQLSEKEKSLKIKIHLLAADNGLSMAAAHLIKDWWLVHAVHPDHNQRFHPEDIPIDFVKHLGVTPPATWKPTGFNRTYYEDGLEQLIQKIAGPKGIVEQTRQAPKDQPRPDYLNNRIIVNFTGGYKAVIPVLTLVAELESLDMQYLFDDSKELMQFPGFPIGLEPTIIERFYPSYLAEKSFPLNGLSDLDRENLLELTAIHHLFRYDEQAKCFKQTLLGKYLADYIERNQPEGKGTLGFMMEYKVFEYRSHYPYLGYTQALQRSYLPSQLVNGKKHLPPGVKDEEIDLYFQNEQGDFIICEVKSVNQVNPRSKLMKQIKARMGALETLKKLPKEFHLYYYYWNRFPPAGTSLGVLAFLKDLKDSCHKLSKGKTTFRAFHMEMKVNDHSHTTYKDSGLLFDQKGNEKYRPFITFMKESLSDGAITEVEIPG